MAGLADTRAIAAGRADFGGRGDLAAVGVEPEERALFPAADRFLDHSGNNSHHLFALDTEFALAGTCALLLGGMTILSYAGKIPPTYSSVYTREELRFWFLDNVFGFFAIAYLASLLAQSLRRKGIELEAKRLELAELQEFTEDIIHSMRGGLITTDMDGRIVLLNRTGEEILGHRFADIRGKKLSELNEQFWLAGLPDVSDRLSLR